MWFEWSCSRCVSDLVHVWLGLPHVSHHGTSELHGGSRGGVHDCGRLPKWGGAALQDPDRTHEARVW